MIRFFILCLEVLFVVFGSSALAETVQINTTSDGYLYLGSPTSVNSTGYYLDVGLYGTPGNHYSIAYAKFNTDLSSLSGARSIYLALNLRNFVAPVFGNGSSAQPTGLDYPTSGGNFTLKVVPLTSSFTGTGIDAAWVTTNLIGPSAAGTIVLQNGGYNYVDITSTVKSWITNSSSVKELGFVGIASKPNTWSLNLGTMEDQIQQDSYSVISAATPMYLTDSPPAPVVRSSRIISTNQMELTFDVVPGVSYVLKTKSNLADTNWATFYPSFVASSSSTNLTVPMTNSLGRGFFRLETAP